jgi:hypothetical protein
MMVLPVLSQRTYPGAGDIDDCWAVATIWAAAASKSTIVYPTITTFRMKAGVPDLPGPTGGNIYDCNKGADGCWPTLTNYLNVSSSFEAVKDHLRAGRPGSISVLSSALPSRLQYNFLGTHQVGIQLIGSALYCMNPLAPANSTPGRITYAELQPAMRKLIPGAAQPYRALFFPKPTVGAPLWGWDVDADITEAYGATAVGRKLREVGVPTWGDRINEVDLEAGLRARNMTFGTSVQLIDVRNLMRPGTGPT